MAAKQPSGVTLSHLVVVVQLLPRLDLTLAADHDADEAIQPLMPRIAVRGTAVVDVACTPATPRGIKGPLFGQPEAGDSQEAGCTRTRGGVHKDGRTTRQVLSAPGMPT